MRAPERWRLAGCERLEGRTTPTSAWTPYGDGLLERVARTRESVQPEIASIPMAISAAMSTGTKVSAGSLVVSTTPNVQTEPIGGSVVPDSNNAGDTTGAHAQNATAVSGTAASAFTILRYTGPGFVMRFMPDGTIQCGAG
jgi:hypothetical protein